MALSPVTERRIVTFLPPLLVAALLIPFAVRQNAWYEWENAYWFLQRQAAHVSAHGVPTLFLNTKDGSFYPFFVHYGGFTIGLLAYPAALFGAWPVFLASMVRGRRRRLSRDLVDGAEPRTVAPARGLARPRLRDHAICPERCVRPRGLGRAGRRQRRGGHGGRLGSAPEPGASAPGPRAGGAGRVGRDPRRHAQRDAADGGGRVAADRPGAAALHVCGRGARDRSQEPRSRHVAVVLGVGLTGAWLVPNLWLGPKTYISADHAEPGRVIAAGAVCADITNVLSPWPVIPDVFKGVMWIYAQAPALAIGWVLVALAVVLVGRRRGARRGVIASSLGLSALGAGLLALIIHPGWWPSFPRLVQTIQMPMRLLPFLAIVMAVAVAVLLVGHRPATAARGR